MANFLHVTKESITESLKTGEASPSRNWGTKFCQNPECGKLYQATSGRQQTCPDCRAAKPQLCACGCGGMTSGRMYRRQPARYIAGHAIKNKPMRTRAKRTGWPSDKWFRLIDHCRREKGWTLKQLGKEARVSGKSLRDHQEPHAVDVFKIARALDIDREKAMRLARPDKGLPSAAGWKILELEAAGMSLSEIAAQAGVSRRVLEQHKVETHKTCSDEVLERLTPVLKLTAVEIKALNDRRYRPRGRQSQALIEKRLRALRPKMQATAYKDRMAERSSDLWKSRRPDMERALREAGKKRRAKVPEDELRALVAAGKTYVEIGETFGVSKAIAAARAHDLGLMSECARRRRQCRAATRAVRGRVCESESRRQEALQCLEALGDRVLEIGYRTFAKACHVDEKWARTALKQAKEQARIAAGNEDAS